MILEGNDDQQRWQRNKQNDNEINRKNDDSTMAEKKEKW